MRTYRFGYFLRHQFAWKKFKLAITQTSLKKWYVPRETVKNAICTSNAAPLAIIYAAKATRWQFSWSRKNSGSSDAPFNLPRNDDGEGTGLTSAQCKGRFRPRSMHLITAEALVLLFVSEEKGHRWLITGTFAFRATSKAGWMHSGWYPSQWLNSKSIPIVMLC